MKKDKVFNILNNFFKRNNEYAIEVYLNNIELHSITGRLLVPSKRKFSIDKEKNEYRISWGKGANMFTIPCDEVVVCNEETDKWGSQAIDIITTNFISIKFECVGMAI